MPDMSGKIALYYPHIAFPNDAWVKLAALYWDKLGRIVPPDYQHHDSHTVKKLQGELGFIEDFQPVFDADLVSSQFCALLDTYGEQLVRRYGIFSHSAELAYVDGGHKVAGILQKSLLRLGLAVSRRDYKSSRIGMHPRLAFVYMEALAEQMAYSNYFQPITNEVRAHTAMGPYTLERLVQALLDPDGREPHLIGPNQMLDEMEGLMATIAFQSVLPQDIANVPVEKIILLRQKHRTELTAFQDGIRDLLAKLDMLQEIKNPDALKTHLEVTYDKELKPQLDDLKHSMHSIGIGTVSGVLNVKLVVPFLLASGAAQHFFTLPPVVVGAATIASCTIPVFLKNREMWGERVRKSPASYLLYIQEEVKPTTVVSQIAQGTRKALLGA